MQQMKENGENPQKQIIKKTEVVYMKKNTE